MENIKPIVGIIMGSDSDLPVMNKAVEVLKDFDIEYEMRVISAHRTPHDASDYGLTSYKRGVKVIIAGAGGAAHLAGVLAANSPLPVIGVPVQSKALNGMDSLLSTVQMPPGVPVATVGIDGAKNAALLAVQILALRDEDLFEKYMAYKERIANESRAKNGKSDFTELKNMNKLKE